MDEVGRLHGSLHAGTQMNSAEELIERARRGDDAAFHSIFEQHHRFIMRFIYGMIGRRALAEELTQETFMAAYRNLGTLRDETKLSTWLCGIAKNLTYKHLHSHARERSQITVDDESIIDLRDDDPTPDRQFLNKELKRVIHAALAALDADKRLVFTLKVLQQQSYEEIAEATGYTIPKLKTDLHRAKAEMRRRIRPYLEVSHEM